MNRRTFFKRAATICAGVAAVAVAPAVLVAGEKKPFKPNPMQQDILQKIATQRKITMRALAKKLEANLFAPSICLCPRD